MKNPLIPILQLLPDDGSKIIITKEFSKQVLAFLNAAEPKYREMAHADKLLHYLHQHNVIELSYAEVGEDRINFIRKKI